jgi:hypothetical protein
MEEYCKIQTVFFRNPETKFKTLLEGQYSTPEIEYLAGNSWDLTEKVDGTNIRVTVDGDAISFRGRTDAASIPATLVNRLRELFPEDGKLRSVIGDSGTLYGEGFGARIQKNGSLYSKTQDFVLFDVRIGKYWLRRTDVVDIARKLSLKAVPLVAIGTLETAIEMARKGFKSDWGDFDAEGIVARPTTELLARDGTRIITKIKHRDFGA